MKMIEVYALRGSISYGELTPTRLKEILLGASPADAEKASVFQSLVETDAVTLNGTPAADLALELNLTLEELDARCIELTGKHLGEASFSANLERS